MLQVSSPLVSIKWLKEHLNHPDLVILNASLGKPQTDSTNIISEMQIPKTRLFDIKTRFSDGTAPFPNTFPSLEQFVTEAKSLGISDNSCIIVFDEKGIYSSARVWWMFKAFGHTNVAVLNGGLPSWKKAGFGLEPYEDYTGTIGDFSAKLDPSFIAFFKDMEDMVHNQSHTILDARSESRFLGLEEEPRAGLRAGNIPTSKNLPFENLLENGEFKSREVLKKLFDTVTEKDKPMVFSCGSGITACILALGAEMIGYKELSVYDGSWTEWGTLVK